MANSRTSATLLAAALTACSGPQVHSLGTGGELPAFELRGQDLADLHDEAARLCHHGYTVLRQAQRMRQALPADNMAAPWLQQAGDWLSGTPGNEAQVTVQCRA